MKTCIVSVGSRGDIEPLIPLALQLMQVGYDVTLITNSDMAESIRSHGIDFIDLGFNVAEILSSQLGKKMLSSYSASQSRDYLIKAAVEHHEQVGQRIIEACKGAQLILSNETVYLLCSSIAEKLKVKHIALCLIPYGTTNDYPSLYADTEKYSGMSNRETHMQVHRHHHESLLPPVNKLRNMCLSLPSISLQEAIDRREKCTTLLGYSPSVYPPSSDWDTNKCVTGYWRLRQKSFAPPNALTKFIEQGTMPIYIGFGSMIYDTNAFIKILISVAEQTQQRIIYSLGWNQIKLDTIDVPPQIFVLTDSVAHSWLFPKMKAIVHHGGAGTTAASIESGKPTLIAWFMVDQSFWAKHIAALKIGLNLGSFHDLDPEMIINSLNQMETKDCYEQNSRMMAKKVLSENGLENAVNVINKIVAQQCQKK
ncbi:MAG: glycosyltransferase [Nitrososphaerales archaeon]